MALETTTHRLAAIDDAWLTRLGFRFDDRRDVLLAIERALGEPVALARVQLFTDQLRSRIGDFESEADPFVVPDGYDELDTAAIDQEWGIGVLPMLALIASADDVAAYHAGRGISAVISTASLSDLGQQAWVHRRTFGSFGLHTYGWMQICWSGALYWLGRLQFNLTRLGGAWVVSTHIPESGPLTPEAVADSFGRARGFFAGHFPEYPTRLFHCDSWLLDPQLAEVLVPESNMVHFQRLWQLDECRRNGDGDVMFFVFHRRSDVDHATLPQGTSLQRAIVQKIKSGGHWYVREGTVEQDRFPIVDEQ